MLQVQHIWLSDMGTAYLPCGVDASGVCIELQGADLAGQVTVGTCLSVFGAVMLDRQPDNNAVRAWADIQVASSPASWHILSNQSSLPRTGGLPPSSAITARCKKCYSAVIIMYMAMILVACFISCCISLLVK